MMQTLRVVTVGLLCAIATIARADLFDAPQMAVGPLAANQTHVDFAGGAVKLVYDAEVLTASELPRGRQVLLVLSRHEPPQTVANLTDGLWIAYHALPPAEADLLAVLQNGLKRDLRRARLTAYKPISLASERGVRQSFALPRSAPLFTPPGKKADTSGQATQGWRQLLRTDHGLIEIHFAAPAGKFVEREEQLSNLLATLQLATPRASAEEVAPELLDAEPIVGRWKSRQGLLELTGDGTVRLTYDREKNYRLDKRGLVDYEKPVRRLQGSYQAEGDLLRIRWADGSLLNIRWRTAGQELLITDHHGRTRRLARLYR